MLKETALRLKDYVEEAKRYNAQSYSNMSDTRRHRDQVEAMVEKVAPLAHEPLAHEKETGDKGKEQDSTWKSEAPGIRFTARLPQPINEENSAKEEMAEALEAARIITCLYNEMAETADNRTEAILTRSCGEPGHGTLQRTRASKQAGKALRSQGHPHARVM